MVDNNGVGPTYEIINNDVKLMQVQSMIDSMKKQAQGEGAEDDIELQNKNTLQRFIKGECLQTLMRTARKELHANIYKDPRHVSKLV